MPFPHLLTRPRHYPARQLVIGNAPIPFSSHCHGLRTGNNGSIFEKFRTCTDGHSPRARVKFDPRGFKISAFVTKPFHHDDLRHVIRQTLGTELSSTPQAFPQERPSRSYRI